MLAPADDPEEDDVSLRFAVRAFRQILRGLAKITYPKGGSQ